MTTFSDYISGADLAGVIPVEYVPEIMQGAVEQSAAMSLAARLPDMPTSTRIMPVLDVMPIAYFRSGETDTVQTTDAQWRNVTITAEELDVIVPIPLTALDDANMPIWDRVKPLIEQAVGKAIDAAVFFGTNKPSSWPTAIVTAAAAVTPTSHSISLAACEDMYDALLGDGGVLSVLEQNGYIATGHVSHPIMRGKLRGVRDAEGQPLFRSPGMANGTDYTLDGAPIRFPVNGSMSASYFMISGQWSELVYAMRQDISWFIANQGVIQDTSSPPHIIYNLFQQRMVALMVTMRLGFAVPNPVTAMQATQAARYPFSVLVA